MTSRRFFVLGALACAVALVVSAILYRRSQAANFDAHADAIEAIGRVRDLDRLRSEQVLAARFGLLNQYDSINRTENDLSAAQHDLPPRIRASVSIDPGLEDALSRLDASVAVKRNAAERFKSENSILRNSTYYLPTASNELGSKLAERNLAASVVVRRVAQTALAYNLIGDESARQTHLQALEEMRAHQTTTPNDLRQPFGLLLAHGDVIAREVPAVDGWVAQVVADDTNDALASVERNYHARFSERVRVANTYRMILYGWSLLLLALVAMTGLQLRRLYAGLELRVSERTAELNRTTAALWGEMKLARKIQEALVPSLPTLAGCEVAATMKATDEVGGDYYDVIRTGDYDWVLIGDVSGHGVPAGLIMMMCHTSVRTVLREDPNVTPARLLTLVNAVLTESIRHLDEDKYMTISAFRRSHDGTIRFAGAHQDVHIYRAKQGAVETLESRGVWLGLTSDISASLVEQEFRLDAGDAMMLHTDGITEATQNGAMFDGGGLRKVLGNARDASADQIVDNLFKALAGFQIADDATVVVVKQLEETVPSSMRSSIGNPIACLTA